MVMATRLAEALISEPSVRDCFEDAYLLPRDPPLRLINGTGAVGAVKAFAAATVLCAPTMLRRMVISRAIRPGRLIADRNRAGPPLTDAEILAASGTMFHPSCTCAMGRADNPMASSARASIVGDTVRPIVLAVFKLITSTFLGRPCGEARPFLLRLVAFTIGVNNQAPVSVPGVTT
jgi:hypothetical protein